MSGFDDWCAGIKGEAVLIYFGITLGQKKYGVGNPTHSGTCSDFKLSLKM